MNGGKVSCVIQNKIHFVGKASAMSAKMAESFQNKFYLTGKNVYSGIIGKQLCEERRVLKKVLEEGCVEQLIDLVLEDFGKMRDHTNIKRIQASEFQADQKDKRKQVLQINFAMSYSGEYQHEVQSALWSRANVTLFTAAVIYDSKCQTYLICSDAPNKDKDTISCFLLHLYEKLEKRKDLIQPEVDVIWSDGPSSEFKNRFMVKLLKVLSAKYSKPFHWKYFATSHGKGIVDGIGGSAKSLVRQRVMSCCDKAILVQSAQDFANVAAELMPKTRVFYISQAEITEKSISMSLWNEEVPHVTGIKQVHVIECSSEGNIKLLKSARSNNCDILISECETYSQGDWVLVTYDAEKYSGEVITVKTEEIEVSCMIRSGKYWKWPRNPDIAHYTFGNVIGKLDPPIPATSRGQFYFEKL